MQLNYEAAIIEDRVLQQSYFNFHHFPLEYVQKYSPAVLVSPLWIMKPKPSDRS
jgi:hypothetical protein